IGRPHEAVHELRTFVTSRRTPSVSCTTIALYNRFSRRRSTPAIPSTPGPRSAIDERSGVTKRLNDTSPRTYERLRLDHAHYFVRLRTTVPDRRCMSGRYRRCQRLQSLSWG